MSEPLSAGELRRIANEQYRSEIIYHDPVEGDRDAGADVERLLATISARHERIRQLEAVERAAQKAVAFCREGAFVHPQSDESISELRAALDDAALLGSPQEATE